MFKTFTRSVGVTIFALAASCSWVGPSVQSHRGSNSGLAALNGAWSGQYFGDHGSQPYGTIAFTLTAEADAARGTVIVTPRGASAPLIPFNTDQVTGASTDSSDRRLAIRFTEGSDGMLYGDLDPFWDEDRDTEASTFFRGDVDDDVFAGTFRTTFANGSPQLMGQWKLMKAAEPR